MDELNNILKKFETLSLNDLNKIKLMNRIDTKFVLNKSHLSLFLKQLSTNYKVLFVNEAFYTSYKTQYYDTVNFDLYHSHHNGLSPRYKVRHRNYVESNAAFLEVKLKTNKGRTLKKRIEHPIIQPNCFEKENSFILTNTPYQPENLISSVLINYKRITLFNWSSKEKITVDFELSFSNKSNNCQLHNLIIVEVKQALKEKTTALTLLKELAIKPISFSKYCMGVTQLYPSVKKNNFKQKLVTLNKLLNNVSLSHTTSF